MVLLPVEITQLVTDSLHWHVIGIVGSILCKFFHFASSMSLFVSVQSLVWIAIDRFVAVVFFNKTWPYFKQDSDNSYSFYLDFNRRCLFFMAGNFGTGLTWA